MFYYKVTTSESGAAGALRMHSTPDTSEDSVISAVPHGAVVTGSAVALDTNGMRYVSYNGKWGWVAIRFLTECDEDGTLTADKQTNVTPSFDEDYSPEKTEKKEVNGKKWLIIGGITLAVGAMMNVLM